MEFTEYLERGMVMTRSLRKGFDVLQKRLELLRGRYKELRKKIKRTENEREQERMYLEQFEIEDEMEKVQAGYCSKEIVP